MHEKVIKVKSRRNKMQLHMKNDMLTIALWKLSIQGMIDKEYKVLVSLSAT